ncbi:hypothetical protein [Paenibacillus zanthoxyli]|uniref:hypothetical protein n=1 Tax=Paenibacillus zanthoxyli TaxID=369399 RepID=UPI0012EC79B9|nr:hypothetical protein [Paenibacillus zanthoxyli]
MIGGRVLISDYTHVNANANKRQYMKQQDLQYTLDYMGELNDVVETDRRAHRKESFKA